MDGIITDKFEYGHFLYMYYSYLDDFHTEPQSWSDLFERNDYRDTETTIKKLVQDYYSKE